MASKACGSFSNLRQSAIQRFKNSLERIYKMCENCDPDAPVIDLQTFGIVDSPIQSDVNLVVGHENGIECHTPKKSVARSREKLINNPDVKIQVNVTKSKAQAQSNTHISKETVTREMYDSRNFTHEYYQHQQYEAHSPEIHISITGSKKTNPHLNKSTEYEENGCLSSLASVEFECVDEELDSIQYISSDVMFDQWMKLEYEGKFLKFSENLSNSLGVGDSSKRQESLKQENVAPLCSNESDTPYSIQPDQDISHHTDFSNTGYKNIVIPGSPDIKSFCCEINKASLLWYNVSGIDSMSEEASILSGSNVNVKMTGCCDQNKKLPFVKLERLQIRKSQYVPYSSVKNLRQRYGLFSEKDSSTPRDGRKFNSEELTNSKKLLFVKLERLEIKVSQYVSYSSVKNLRQRYGLFSAKDSSTPRDGKKFNSEELTNSKKLPFVKLERLEINKSQYVPYSSVKNMRQHYGRFSAKDSSTPRNKRKFNSEELMNSKKLPFVKLERLRISKIQHVHCSSVQNLCQLYECFSVKYSSTPVTTRTTKNAKRLQRRL